MDRLVPEWRALWQRVPNATPFQSPEWLLSWWDCFGNGAPFVLTDLEDGQLIAVLPLYHLDEAGCCKLLPVGISLSDYLDALVDSDHSEAAGALLGSLVDLPGWEECHIPDLPLGGSFACSSMSSAAHRTTRCRRDLSRSRSAQCARGVARVGILSAAVRWKPRTTGSAQTPCPAMGCHRFSCNRKKSCMNPETVVASPRIASTRGRQRRGGAPGANPAMSCVEPLRMPSSGGFTRSQRSAVMWA
jgi:hypothetical protein